MSKAVVSKKVVTEVAIDTKSIALDGTNILELVASLNDTKNALKALEAQEKAVRAEILELMGSAEEATVAGIVQVELKEQTRTDINRQDLKEAFPEAYELCLKETTYKVLRTK